ncbi:MAG: two-component sensor histidine kinase [Chromatiales bacterium 21-64-14]|nr:MAG: two-component sensor histidine kinase [Chromatiales bacterium 21-64-14]HQU14482.1 ATP-binding protein [Gammaproteobacteria bacterium]
MPGSLLKRLLTGIVPAILLVALLLISLHLMGDATQKSVRADGPYSWLLLVNVAGLVVLLILIGNHLFQLVRQYRERVAGSRLTLRLVAMFIVLSVVPVSVVYYFSLQFLHRGIDSWFDLRIEHALSDALELSRAALDMRMRELLRGTKAMAGDLADTPNALVGIKLNDLRVASDASELSVYGQGARVLAVSSANASEIVPDRPGDGVLLALRQGHDYVGLDVMRDHGLHVRAVVNIPSDSHGSAGRLLQALYPVPERMGALADSVQAAFAQYKELSYLRQSLKYSFTLTLTLVLLLSLLSAVWAAFFSARRVMEPIRELAEGTRAVAAGEYDKRLPVVGHDELAFLVRSFNDMTRKIALSRNEARHSQRQAERQRAYVEAVLGRLSSGVLVLDRGRVLRTVNDAAGHILGVGLGAWVGRRLEETLTVHPQLGPFVDVLVPYLLASGSEWRAEATLFGGAGRQVLMCRGTPLSEVGSLQSGHVIVFDDVTALIQAQRDAAWGEVARRLAHEIKNPLTPIQLSAERLRRKFLADMKPADAEVLDRATHTIVQQVEAMKAMVNAFTQYAHAPPIRLTTLDLNELIGEVLELYRGGASVLRIQANLEAHLPMVHADSGRLRQLLHNLVKNAMEATVRANDPHLIIATVYRGAAATRYIEVSVEDNGPGFPDGVMAQLFEPYVTTKPKGTGLGLAIVKKIVEEHGGLIWAENHVPTGARVIIRLPVATVRVPAPVGQVQRDAR